MKVKILVCISIVIMLMGCSKSVENNKKMEKISEVGVDKKIYEYPIETWSFRETVPDSTKISC